MGLCHTKKVSIGKLKLIKVRFWSSKGRCYFTWFMEKGILKSWGLEPKWYQIGRLSFLGRSLSWAWMTAFLIIIIRCHCKVLPASGVSMRSNIMQYGSHTSPKAPTTHFNCFKPLSSTGDEHLKCHQLIGKDQVWIFTGKYRIPVIKLIRRGWE